MHTANLILRFLLELAALAGFAALTWTVSQGIWRYVAVVAAISLIGAVWVAFAVPDDPSRSGSPPVPVPGALRLMLELTILLGGAWAFYAAGHASAALLIALFVTLHYLLWIDRIVWLLQR